MFHLSYQSINKLGWNKYIKQENLQIPTCSVLSRIKEGGHLSHHIWVDIFQTLGTSKFM